MTEQEIKEIEQLAYEVNHYGVIEEAMAFNHGFVTGYKAALQSGEARPVDERYIREVSERIYNKLQSKGIVNTSVWVINEVLDTYFNIEKPDAPVKEVDVEEILYQNGDIVSKTPALSIDLQLPIKEGEVRPVYGEWHLCPKCHGTGRMFPEFPTTIGVSETCNLCNGAKVIVKPIIEKPVKEVDVEKAAENKNREAGFYWVRFNDGDWTVAQWFYSYWLLTGTTSKRNDSSFDEINENRISEWQSKQQPIKQINNSLTNHSK